MASFTPYQTLLVASLALWLAPLMLMWARYDLMPHAKELFLALLFTPILLVDELLLAFDASPQWYFLVGTFSCMPVVIATLLSIAIARLMLERQRFNPLLIWLPAIIAMAAQIPMLLFSTELKSTLLHGPVLGQLGQWWPVYALAALVHFMVLYVAIVVEQRIADYDTHLSEQVVDVQFYRMSAAMKAFGGLITLAFVGLVLTLLVAFNLLPLASWRSLSNVSYYLLFTLLCWVMTERRSYSPSPINYALLKKNNFSDSLLRDTLARAEKALIEHKAYKHIGLRIREFSTVAGVDPNVLAVATHKLLNRNFRAFVFHYRLEYAKNVLMHSDVKVSAVARRLGFDSEKFLSNMFVKYIQQMAKDEKAQDPQDDLKLP
ncbi:AraC family transcriptional regulator [Aliiglaciecola sp. CAU 1673]|uniref:helix-turn-helix domain-containing protein n=1 Tax=Aliiglaciecola sp. CAU 1673 TaxID=3032595 RepID=UPI0023DCD989|nr:AraC family transcriptional regulator [Aliiglaciecola sp. CAU 1673]MDF2178988.1 AraC family transcriptional regulator [Aliiglaciecola sp. CAU 1673]